MGEHIDTRGQKKKLKEHDANARRARASFKRYLQILEEELLEAEADSEDDELIDSSRRNQDE